MSEENEVEKKEPKKEVEVFSKKEVEKMLSEKDNVLNELKSQMELLKGNLENDDFKAFKAKEAEKEQEKIDGKEGVNEWADTYRRSIENITKKHEEELAAIKEQNEKVILENLSIKKNRALEKAMEKSDIAEPYKEAVNAMFSQKLVVEENEVLINTQEGDKIPVDKFFEVWSSSEQGAYYKKPQYNTGGGAIGKLNNAGKVKAYVSEDGKNLATLTEWAELKMSNPEKYEALRSKLN